MRVRALPLFSVAAVLVSLSVEAQISTGDIIGVVRDASGAVLPGVTVTIASSALPSRPRTEVVDAQGEYRFGALPPGVYTLTVSAPSFDTYQESDLRVLVGGTTERDVTLRVAAVTSVISVSGRAPVIDPRRVGITNNLAPEQLEVGVFERYAVQGYMAMLPGVTTTDYNRAFIVMVMGSNINETTFLSDGVSFNNVTSGTSWLTADFDSAQDISVTTLGASAEYQAASGGVLNLVSKSGMNQFHGDMGGFWSPDALTSSPVKRPCASCPEGQIGFHWDKYVDDTVHIGGPIKRDRVWFFGGMIYRGRYGTPPGQPLPPPQERFLDWILDTNNKVTWTVNDRMQFQQTYYGEIWRTLNPNFTSPTRPIATLQRSEAGWADDPNVGSQFTWMINPRTVLTARYGLTKGASERIGFFRDLTTPNHTDSVTGVQSGNTQAHRFSPRRDEASAKLNSYVPGDVSHNIAYGVQISRNKDLFVSIEPGGVIYNDANGQPDQATFIGPDARGGVSRAQAVWAEDEITMRRLTLKVGARFDRMEGISPDVPQFDGRFNETGVMLKGLGHVLTWNQVSPRVGANVRLTEDGKTVIRVVAGRYYLPLFLSEFEHLDPSRAVITLARYSPASCDGTMLASCYGTTIAVTSPSAQVRFDPKTKAPYTDQFSIGLDREIANNFGIGINVVHKSNGNPLGWMDAGGVYGTQNVTISGQTIFGQTVTETLTVFPLLSSPTSRLFLKTNPPGFYNRYNALILTATRRLANGWQFSAGYTRQRSLGIDPPAFFSTVGLDPNSLVNLAGGLGARDRPNMFTLMGSNEVPKVGVQVSGNVAVVSGTAVASVALVGLPQGRLPINLESPGSRYRTPREKYLHMRVTKFLFRTGSQRLELAGEVKNALQETGSPDIQTLVFDSSNFLQPNMYPEPRQLRLFARWFF